MSPLRFGGQQGARGAYVQCTQGQPATATASRGCRRRARNRARDRRVPARTGSSSCSHYAAGSCRLPGCCSTTTAGARVAFLFDRWRLRFARRGTRASAGTPGPLAATAPAAAEQLCCPALAAAPGPRTGSGMAAASAARKQVARAHVLVGRGRRAAAGADVRCAHALDLLRTHPAGRCSPWRSRHPCLNS